NRRLEAHIAQAVEPKPDHDGATLILDIDAFRQAEVLLEEDDVEARIEKTFAELHEFKNEIFFASLSETMIEGFE
ncbi:MAG: TIGR04255 family protein, partial [Acidobacteria bacterium]